MNAAEKILNFKLHDSPPPAGPTCSTCPHWVGVPGKEGGECRYDPPQLLALPQTVETLRGPQMTMAIQGFQPQTLPEYFCSRHPDRNRGGPEMQAALAKLESVIPGSSL